MGTSDVLKVLKIARAVGECNLRTFKTSLVPINHEMHEQVHTIFYLLYSQQNYSRATLYALRTGKSSVKFLKGFEKIQKISRKLNFQLKAVKVRKSVFNSRLCLLHSISSSSAVSALAALGLLPFPC